MSLLGKLSPTNGGSISVYPVNRLTGQRVRTRLLLNNGDRHFEGTLRITMGNFINAPKQVILAWISACGRSNADIRGRANKRNTVHFFRDDKAWMNLHFAELAPARVPARRLAATPSARPGSMALVASSARGAIKPGPLSSTVPQPVSVLRDHRWADLPSRPGVYWWYFPESDLDRFRITELCQMSALRLRRSQDGKLCLYHGMAENLAQRIAWHAEQDLTVQALRSGRLSTLRFTLLALNGFDYLAGRQEIDRFMDRLSHSWMETASTVEADAIESSALKGDFHYPLNIKDNDCVELARYTRFLRSMRTTYKRRYI